MMEKLEERKTIGTLQMVLIAVAVLVIAYSAFLVIDTKEAGSSDSLMELSDRLINDRFASDNLRDKNKEITDRLKPFEQLIDIIAGYDADLQVEYNSMKLDLEKFDIEKILTITIDYPDSIEFASGRLNNVIKILNNYSGNFRKISILTAAKIRVLKLDKPLIQPLIDTIYYLVYNGDYNINEYFLIQDSIVKHIAKLQTFLSDNKGKYKMVGEEVRFSKKKDQLVFTKFGNRLLELWQKEKEWLIRIKQQEGIVDEKIHAEIEKYL
jgi:hypothetical protein